MESDENEIKQVAELVKQLNKKTGFSALPDYAKTAILNKLLKGAREDSAAPAAAKTKIKLKTSGLRELFTQKKPKSTAEKVVLTGYFLEHEKNKTEFNAVDLLEEFNKIKERKPSNISVDINIAIKNGWLEQIKMEKNRKICRVTHLGDLFVEQLPNRTEDTE